MKILKKNQIVIIVIAVMLITAGYLNYKTGDEKDLIATSNLMDSEKSVAEIGDAKLVNSNNIIEQNNSSDKSTKNKEELVKNEDEDENIVKDNIVKDNEEEKENVNENKLVKETSAKVEQKNDSYFATSRLTRDTMYSQMIESYEKILENQSVSTEQKAIAQTEIKKINELKNSIMITENLIKTKGFNDVIIFVNDSSINAIIKAGNLKQEDIAQIQNIITRELKVDLDNIHISSK